MRFTIQGRSHHIDADQVRAVLTGRRPEPVQAHWVAVLGHRWPVKQALELCLGIYRAEFTSDTARRIFQRLGFEVSPPRQRHVPPLRHPPAAPTQPQGLGADTPADDPAYAAWRQIANFLVSSSPTQAIRDAQEGLRGATGASLGELPPADVGEATIGWTALLHQRADRVHLLNNITAVVQVVRTVLGPDEKILGTPNISGRRTHGVDLDTTHRHAQFVLGRHSPANTVRQRAAAASLVHLVLTPPATKVKQLWVSDPALLTFLQTTDKTMRWGLSRSAEAIRERFEDTHETLDQTIRSFLARTDIELCDIADVLPHPQSII